MENSPKKGYINPAWEECCDLGEGRYCVCYKYQGFLFFSLRRYKFANLCPDYAGWHNEKDAVQGHLEKSPTTEIIQKKDSRLAYLVQNQEGMNFPQFSEVLKDL